jgi:hypothetical protein
MNETTLAQAIQKPEIHRRLLGKYKGAYALGVMNAPNEDGAALLLRIEGVVPEKIPKRITVDGELVPVIVVGGFKAPKPL